MQNVDLKKRLKGWEKRRKAMCKLRDSGLTWAEIGRRYGVSRERVRQIYVKERGNG